MRKPEDTRFHPDGPETDSEGFPLDTETAEQPNQAQSASAQVQEQVAITTEAEVVALSPGAMPDEKGSDPRDGSYEI